MSDVLVASPAVDFTDATVMLAAYPEGDEALINDRAEAEMQAVIELVSRVRNIRTELNVKPSEEVRLIISAGGDGLGRVFDASLPQIKRLVRAGEVWFKESMAEVPRASARALDMLAIM